jgi:hypothetical protein
MFWLILTGLNVSTLTILEISFLQVLQLKINHSLIILQLYPYCAKINHAASYTMITIYCNPIIKVDKKTTYFLFYILLQLLFVVDPVKSS